MRSRVIDENRTPGASMYHTNYNPAFQYAKQPVQNNIQPSPSAPRPPVKAVPVAAQRPFALAPAEGWLALILLAIALYCVVSSIEAAQWVEHSAFLLWSPVVGLLVGLLIAKVPRFPQSILHLGACLIGHWLAIWLTSAFAYHIPWVNVLGYLRAAFSGQLGNVDMQASSVIFFFYLAFLCFFLGYFGSWLVYRAHLPWLVTLVYCSIMLVNLNYVRHDMSYLVLIMLGALVLLVGRMHLTIQIAQWRREGLHTDRKWLWAINKRCMQIACVIVALMLPFGWLLPSLPQPDSGRVFWDHLNTAWNSLLTGHFSLQDLSSGSNANFFGDQLTISNSVHLPTGDVITYRNSDNGTQAHYLESFSYSQFDGRTWRTTLNDSGALRFGANQQLPQDTNQMRQSGAVSVTILQPPQGTKNYIFAPEQPAQFDVATVVYSDGKAGAWTQQSPLRTNETYKVVFYYPSQEAQSLSAVPLPKDNNGLWQADRYYQSLQANYLQIPGDLSPNVRKTLQQWTGGADNTYSALKALEQHFSDTNVFIYSLDNQPLPDNTDVVDWLLQSRRGYCTYYASAMAVMGRMLGIPTRVINGFSQGHFDKTHNMWVVSGTDAHTWVQAYFPTYGWISFDPTPGFSPSAAPPSIMQATPVPVVTPTSAPPTVTPAVTKTPAGAPPANVTHPKPPASQANQVSNPALLMSLSIGVLILLLAVLLAVLARAWWRNLYANSTFVAGTFWRFCRLASWAGLAPKAWQTPYEYSTMLSQQFPREAPALWHLTEMFVHDRWGPPQSAPYRLADQDAERLWRSLRTIFLSLFSRKIKRQA